MTYGAAIAATSTARVVGFLPSPAAEYGTRDYRIRAAAWRAGDHERSRRNLERWDRHCWNAAAAEWERLSAHPWVERGECPVCCHVGEDCDGTREARLRCGGQRGTEGGYLYVTIAWERVYTGRHLARGKAERKHTRFRVSGVPAFTGTWTKTFAGTLHGWELAKEYAEVAVGARDENGLRGGDDYHWEGAAPC